jgi:hypothetical protein
MMKSPERSPRGWKLWITMTLLLFGCVTLDEDISNPLSPASLIEHEAWAILGGADDPWLSHASPESYCTNASIYGEEGTLEIDTTECDYIALHQPALIPITAGDLLEIIAWHSWLFDDDPNVSDTTAHVLLQIEDTPLWDHTITIPAEPDAFSVLWNADTAFPVGTDVYFHIHNHGSNTYNLLSIEVLP